MAKKLGLLIFFVVTYLIMIVAVRDIDRQVVDITQYYKPKEEFSLYFTVDRNDVEYNLEWWKNVYSNGDDYFISLPYGVDLSKARVNFTAEDEITINGKTCKNGDKLKKQDSYRITAGDKEYTLTPLNLSKIPALHIVTDDGRVELVDKEVKKAGYMIATDRSGLLFEGELEYIKGRGNNSWDDAKKGFGISTVEKIPLLGMAKADKWVLVPSNLDHTLVKNKVIYNLGEKVSLDYTPDCRYVDLFINGEYWGNYLVSEKIEMDKNRVDIVDLEKVNKKNNGGRDLSSFPQAGMYRPGAESVYGSKKWIDMPGQSNDVTGGYLMEIQVYYRYDKGVSGFVSNYGQNFVLKSPEHASEKQINYISNYYNEFERALLAADGYNRQGRHYSEYIDMPSFAKMYLLQELAMNNDAGRTSTFLYKDENGKIFAGPAWDFDYSGVKEGRTTFEATQEEMVSNRRMLIADPNRKKYTVFSLLWQQADFRRLCRSIWQENFEPAIPQIVEYTDDIYEQINISAVTDRTKWRQSSISQTLRQTEEEYRIYVEDYKYFLENRADFIKRHTGA